MIVAKSERQPLPYFNSECFAGLTNHSWICILCLTVFVSLFLYIVEKIRYLNGSKLRWVDGFIYTVGLLFQRDIGGSNPHYMGSRAIAVAFAIGTMIIITAYTAELTANNVNYVKKLPISGFYDPKVTKPTSDFRFETYRDTSLSYIFEKNEKQMWRDVGSFMQPYNFESTIQAFEAFRKGKLQAIIIPDKYLSKAWRESKNCDIQKAGKGFISEEWAFALPKGSQWKQPISSYLREYKEYGLISDIERNWMSGTCTNEDKDAMASAEQYSLLYLSGACCMLLGGLVLSVVIFISACAHSALICCRL